MQGSRTLARSLDIARDSRQSSQFRARRVSNMIGFAKSALRKTGAFDAAKTLYERVGGTVYRPETGRIERTFQGRTDVFFVQIGAHDGKTNDYIYPIARKLGWRGILVEPIPYLFERLVQNYRGSQGLIFENAALAEQMGQKWFYRLRQSDDPNLPEWYDKLASLNKDVVLSHRNAIPNIDDLIIQEEVKKITFDDLAQRYQITAIDLILIATEGYDLNILK